MSYQRVTRGVRVDAAEELRRLHQAAAQLLRPPPTAVGVDTSGTVHVHLDTAGRVERVEIRPDWSRRLGVSAVGRAVVAAAGDAVMARAKAWADAMSRPGPASPQTDGQVAAAHQAPPTGRDDERRQAELHDLMVTVRNALAEVTAFTERLDALAVQPVEGRSQSGRATVTLRGLQIVKVDLALPWLQQQPTGRQVAHEIESACRQAYDVEAELAADAAAEAPHIAAVRELARLPQEFIEPFRVTVRLLAVAGRVSGRSETRRMMAAT